MKGLILMVGAEASPTRVEIQKLCDKFKEAYGYQPVEITDADFAKIEIAITAEPYEEPRYLVLRNKRTRLNKGEKARRRKERWS